MIYLSDDYLTKYSDTLSYIIARSYQEGYAFDYIERSVAYSKMISELEKSNITLIAFSSMEKNYSDIFPNLPNNYSFNPYDIFGWIGNMYMHLFLSLEVTFESLFYIVPIEEMMKLYHLYHEMDYAQLLDYVKGLIRYSVLDIIMKKKKMSNEKLASKAQISSSTISALRYGNRDILKLDSYKLLMLSHGLNVKMESLFPHIYLEKN